MNDPVSLPTALSDPSTPEGIIALIFPIVAVIMGIGAVMIRMWFDYRRRRELFQLHHAERMSAIEKGIDVPSLPAELYWERPPTPRATYLYRGLVWLFVGVAIGIAILSTSQNSRLTAWSLVPIGVGVANLFYYFLAPSASVTSEPDVRKAADIE